MLTMPERPLALKDVDVARQLQISRAAVWKKFQTGEIRTIHIGRSVRVLASELDRYVASLAKQGER